MEEENNIEKRSQEEPRRFASEEASPNESPAETPIEATPPELANRKRKIETAISVICAVPAAMLTMISGVLMVYLYMIKDGIRNTSLKSMTEADYPAKVLKSADILKDTWSTNGMHSAINILWIMIAIGIALMLMCVILAIYSCGQRDESGRIKLIKFDRMWTEFQLLIGLMLACTSIPAAMFTAGWTLRSNLTSAMIRRIYSAGSGINRTGIAAVKETIWFGGGFGKDLPMWGMITIGVILLAIALWSVAAVILSIARTIKAGEFWEHTLAGNIIKAFVDYPKDKKHFGRKVMACIIIACLLCLTKIGAILVICLAVYYVPKWIRKYQSIKKGVGRMKNGDVEYRIPVTGSGELDELAADINDINSAQNQAMQKELKSQRLKTALISNVSHDLKTPLTSMVTYVDLLKKEGLDSENAPEYLRIIDEKTERLRQLTQDLFDAAKASSGALPMDIEKLDMMAIAEQAAGEIGDRMEKADVELIIEKKDNPQVDGDSALTETGGEQEKFSSLNMANTMVLADGRYLWRVIENLLSNTSKYALAGTRAYMDIMPVPERGIVRLEIKNTSRDQLNIDPDELMERFTRGDASRNTEGSGLGLSIARDLTRMMNGEFYITIDGDLFKATVEMPMAEAEMAPA